MLKVKLYLLGFKAYKVLNELINYQYRSLISEVIFARDSNVMNDYANEIYALCKANSIKVTARDKESYESKEGIFCLAIGWRWLIPTTHPLIVLHDSLLPKYRGFAPLVNMLIAGEPKIGVTALYASENYDEGDIIAQASVTVKYPIKIKDAILTISLCYIDICLKVLRDISDSNVLPLGLPQNHQDATYSVWRDENDYFINWKDNAYTIARFVDAVGDPYFGARTYMGKDLVRINDVEVVEDRKVINRDIGKVLWLDNGLPCVICGEGVIKICNMEDAQGNSLLPLKKFRTRFK